MSNNLLTQAVEVVVLEVKGQEAAEEAQEAVGHGWVKEAQQ